MGLKKQIICRGVFSQGQLHGIGRYQFENGDIHDGIFLNGQLHLGKYELFLLIFLIIY